MKTLPIKSDILHQPALDAVHLSGLIGQRFEGSRTNRLRLQEEDHLLWPFQEHCKVGWSLEHPQRPGIRADWQGEFIGTWLDAAIRTAWNTSDDELKAKIEGMVNGWLATQAPDGYLGTYDENDRWLSWDVWVQAHDMIGLIGYYRATGKADFLQAAARIADRVLQDFGPGKRRLVETGPSYGMASSAILEPMIWLYWETGDERYLQFGRWLVDEDWESEKGPKIVSTLLDGRGVANTANAKGIEMLTNLAGLLELYRATGEGRYLKAAQIAWEDIVSHHLYITGSASTGEFFQKDFTLRNDGVDMVGETCVSMGWLYFNLSLARLTGDACYFDMAEQTLYNHLMSAQSPDGRNWVYYLGLRDSKRYRWHTDPECCPSRGVRAIAQMPGHAITLLQGGIAVNFYDRAEARLQLHSGETVGMHLQTDYPWNGKISLDFDVEKPTSFALYLRLPGWCRSYKLVLNGSEIAMPVIEKGYLVIMRSWSGQDKLSLELDMPARFLADRMGNNGRAAVGRGPLVYAADTAYLPAGTLLDDVMLSLSRSEPEKEIFVEPRGDTVHLLAPCGRLRTLHGEGFWRENERYNRLASATAEETLAGIEMVPFLDAGNRDPQNFREGIQPNDEPVRRITFQVWLPYHWR
jgi:uncharacterized protein